MEPGDMYAGRRHHNEAGLSGWRLLPLPWIRAISVEADADTVDLGDLQRPPPSPRNRS